MPWIDEQRQEDAKDKEAENKKSAKKDSRTQTSLIFASKSKPNTTTKDPVEPGKKAKARAESKSVAKPSDSVDPALKLKLLSRVMKMEGIENFEWKYRPNQLKNGKVELGREIDIKDLQCILISLGWGNHDYILDQEEGADA